MTITTTSNQYLKKKNANLPKAFLLIAFIGMVLIPLFRMLVNINSESIRKVITSVTFYQAVINSLVVTLISTLITLVLSFLLAWCIQRTGIRYKGIFSIILVLPMLIPSISHGMGLIILFGNNGLITNLFHLNFNIYGMWGIVIGSVIYSFPVAFLMLADVMKYEDYSPYEAAKVLGISKFRQFCSITFPYLRKPLISVVFATFTMIITDYGVPLMIGGKFITLPVVMYQEVIGRLDFSKGSVYGAVLLIPAVIAFLFDVLNKDKGNSSFVTKKFDDSKNKIKNFFVYIICGLVSAFIILTILSFIVVGFTKNYPNDTTFTFDNIFKVLRLKGDKYIINSITVAVFVAAIGTSLAFVTAYLTARIQGKLSKILHLISITAMAIPGVVLGLSYVLLFNGSFFYGTIAILIMVNIIHFIASPYLMMYNSFGKINRNLENVGATLGIGRIRMIKDIFLPLSFGTLVEMFSYFFVNSMMTISAVSFLATTATKPISLMINQFQAQMQIENAAIVSLAILIVNITIKGIVYLIKKKRKY